jgi:hypothetical protein
MYPYKYGNVENFEQIEMLKKQQQRSAWIFFVFEGSVSFVIDERKKMKDERIKRLRHLRKGQQEEQDDEEKWKWQTTYR